MENIISDIETYLDYVSQIETKNYFGTLVSFDLR